MKFSHAIAIEESVDTIDYDSKSWSDEAVASINTSLDTDEPLTHDPYKVVDPAWHGSGDLARIRNMRVSGLESWLFRNRDAAIQTIERVQQRKRYGNSWRAAMLGPNATDIPARYHQDEPYVMMPGEIQIEPEDLEPAARSIALASSNPGSR